MSSCISVVCCGNITDAIIHMLMHQTIYWLQSSVSYQNITSLAYNIVKFNLTNLFTATYINLNTLLHIFTYMFINSVITEIVLWYNTGSAN